METPSQRRDLSAISRPSLGHLSAISRRVPVQQRDCWHESSGAGLGRREVEDEEGAAPRRGHGGEEDAAEEDARALLVRVWPAWSAHWGRGGGRRCRADRRIPRESGEECAPSRAPVGVEDGVF